ncbi:MAG: tungsten ABC transporter permease [Nitrososphaeria archaeon]|nr:tungsten ABC transporter permease [Nitrososphaeria archaeon]NIN53620.1 tungsten ABC transporter permease [Nitrososphaeria archaeon]NIQ34141.1 tungsten ABC transporter permease [Nitrososphaeria archaeon]
MYVQTTKYVFIVGAVITVTLFATVYFPPRDTTRESLVVSTTTSLYDTGLLDVLEDHFEKSSDLDLNFISAGTGLAMKHAQGGDADVILVHAPSKEFAFMEEGYGVVRKIVAYNFFAIVGPVEDPARIGDLPPKDALKKIADAGRNREVLWVSRGDDSGTHTKEKSLWKASGLDPIAMSEEGWYIESGTGMGKALQIAHERRAYILADVGTYLKYLQEGVIDLLVLVDEGKELLNVYSVLAVNPQTRPEIFFDGAITFIKYLVSDEGQNIIGGYGIDRYGQSLFFPAVVLLEKEVDPKLVEWIKEFSYFNGSECPLKYRMGHDELYN